MWKTWILDNWRAVLFATVIALVAGLWMRLETVTAQRDAKIVEIDSMRRAATAYQEKSETIAKETGDAFTTLVEQIKDKDIAIQNAKARFGSCNVARGIGAVGVLPTQHGVGQAYSPAGTDGPLAERVAVSREFIDGCAIDAGRLDAWREWAVRNELPVE